MSATLGNTTLSQTDFTHRYRCNAVTQHDLNTTVSASQIIVASGTALFYLVMFGMGILGVCSKQSAKLSSSQGTLFLFLVGALITFVNVLTNADELQIKMIYRFFTVFLIGIVFAVFGAALFFTVPPGDGADAPTLGRQQPSMGLVVTTITFPLVVIEVVLLVASAASKKTDGPAGTLTNTTWIYVLVDTSIFLAQKIIQVIIYLYLQKTITCQEYKENAQFYFRTLSFFNLVEWVDSQVNVNSDVGLSGVGNELRDGWLNAFTDLYTALIIDYRLLCSLLFLEHSVDVIETEHNENEEAGNILEGPAVRNLTTREQLIRNVGYGLGFCCLLAPVLTGLYYVKPFHLKPWVNAFAIIVNSTIVVCGTCLLCSNDLDAGGNTDSPGVKIMVSTELHNVREVEVHRRGIEWSHSI